jgi:hypothetical protein
MCISGSGGGSPLQGAHDLGISKLPKPNLSPAPIVKSCLWACLHNNSLVHTDHGAKHGGPWTRQGDVTLNCYGVHWVGIGPLLRQMEES